MDILKEQRATETLSHGIESFHLIADSMKGKKPVLFFDYDGTLTPIVDDPNAAVLSAERRDFLEELSGVFTIAIISGRGLNDLQSKVKLDQLIHAGSHGFEIFGPNGLEMEYGPGQAIIPVLDEVEETLEGLVDKIKGCNLERKKYALAVHYRRVDKDQIDDVKKAVSEALEGQEQLKVGKGKKILEIKPDLDWDKGRALNWLMEKLNLDWGHHFPIFIGDDITDEDAFRVFNVTGILVGSHGQKTYADYRLNYTGEVYHFLEALRKVHLSGN
jgi:alpha,alpha-trehalase